MSEIRIEPTPGAEVSPRLCMQFMEPLGSSDSSVSAAWDAIRHEWRGDFVACVGDLGPGAIRWGGILSSYWKWREGIGPYEQRQPSPNFLWGGVEPNQVGVHEILDLCERTEAAPIIAVNFAADGRPEYIETPNGQNRAGTPEEAAELIRYCNDDDHAERAANGRAHPWGVKLWQVGNETSYPPAGIGDAIEPFAC
ncbi:MAG: alpha-L-arabinofuranosidase, partial [Pseudomonadota bacterium]